MVKGSGLMVIGYRLIVISERCERYKVQE